MSRTTAQHAIKYLREAQARSALLNLTPAVTMAQIGREVYQPCRAIGVAKRALRNAHNNIDAAIHELNRGEDQ